MTGRGTVAPPAGVESLVSYQLLPGWRERDAVLLPALRTLYSYTERQPDRATGWLYSAGQFGQLPPMAWPEVLAGSGPGLLDQLEATTGIRFPVVCFQAYLNGAGVDWHYDREWNAQAILSLGVTRTFAVRRLDGGYVEEMQLEHGDLLVMSPGFQHVWEHSVPAENAPGERVSLVFRTPQLTEGDL